MPQPARSLRSPRSAAVLAVVLAIACLGAACTTGARSVPPATPPTPAASATPTVAATAAATATPTPTPTATPTPTPTPTPTAPAEPVASTAAIPLADLGRAEFVRRDGTVASLPIEVPPRTEYTIGLSGRTELGERGMLFYYEDGRGNAGFWMRGTHIDLSIAFIDTRGRVISIHEMVAESEDVVRPDQAYEMAIEAPAGWYAAQDVRAGDLARLAFDLPAYLQE